jgi:hypothetical protein
MTFLYFIGSEQKYPWIKQERSAQRILNSARACFKRNRFNQLHKILKPLIKQGNPEALYIAANVSRPKETAEQFNRRHLEFIKQSAAAEYPPALYNTGFLLRHGRRGTHDSS